MTLLGHSDGVGGVSYLDLAGFIIQNGSDVNNDLKELWRRIVYNIAIKNTDDHLRNHGFILTGKGWKLSPAYDINPIYYGQGLTLNISETDNSLDFDLALSVAPYFRIDEGTAGNIISKIKKAIQQWRKIAITYKISRPEIQLMEQAFEVGLR
jgi:serine/threonine-protein kinase HipA